MSYCYVTELHAYDFVIKDFVIKKGHYLCQTLYISPQNGIIFWRAGPLAIQAFPTRWVFRSPSVSVYQLALWEAAFGFSELFWKTLSMYLPISWGVIYERTCPHHAECPAVLDQKRHDPCALPSLFTCSCPKQFFFVSPDGKSPQKEMFCWCGTGKTKNSRSTKRHQNWWVQKLFWWEEKMEAK